MIISEKNIIFLLLHVAVFLFFFFFNLFVMRFSRDSWKGLPENDCGTFFDSFYFTTATHTSIGFGDITPRCRSLRVISSIHMIIVFGLIILSIQ